MTDKKLSVTMGDVTRLGVYETECGINFSVCAPVGSEVRLILYTDGAKEATHRIPMGTKYAVGGVRSVCIGNLRAKQVDYDFEIDGVCVTDPYTRRLARRQTPAACDSATPGASGSATEGVSEAASGGALRSQVSAGVRAKRAALIIPFENMILYKLHVRGFTMDPRSGVRHPGTFLGVIEKIPYLRALGITSVLLMPAYHFFECPPASACRGASGLPDFRIDTTRPMRGNYWGYGPALYFAPKASYTAGEDPQAEFARLVDTLHEKGLECLMEFYFEEETSAGFVCEVLHHWLLTYHVDGFHLLGGGGWQKDVREDPLLYTTKLLFADPDADNLYGRKSGCRNLGEYNLAYEQDMRRFLKGDHASLAGALYRMRRLPIGAAVVNYFADHDGYTMMDMVSYEVKHNEANGEDNRDGTDQNYSWNCGVEGETRSRKIMGLRMGQLRNAWLLLLLSSGVPMIYAGDEFGNSQSGNNNAYCQDNATGWLNWERRGSNQKLRAFVKACIAFRGKHPVFRCEEEPKEVDYKNYGAPEISYHGTKAWFAPTKSSDRAVGILLNGAYHIREDGSCDESFYLAVNMHWEVHTLALPTLPDGKQWHREADTAGGFYPPERRTLLEDQRAIAVPPRSIILLAGR